MLVLKRSMDADRAKAQRNIDRIISESLNPTQDSLAEECLRSFGLDLKLPESIRLHPELDFTLGSNESFGKYPAIVMPVFSGTFQLRAVELLFVTHDAQIAPVVAPHQVAWIDEPDMGCFSFIHGPVGGHWAVAVGMVEALCASEILGLPFAAVASPNDLAAFQIPNGITQLDICASQTCMEEAAVLKARCEARGIACFVMAPPTGNATWQDEFAFRGAVPIDEIAEQAQNQQDSATQVKDSDHE